MKTKSSTYIILLHSFLFYEKNWFLYLQVCWTCLALKITKIYALHLCLYQYSLLDQIHFNLLSMFNQILILFLIRIQ